MHFATATRRLSSLSIRPIRLTEVPGAPRGQELVGQVLGACVMIGLFLVMAMFG